MSDLRQGVSEPVHAVLDLLEKGRDGWLMLSAEALRNEMSIEASVVDGIDDGSDAEPGAVLPFAAALQSPAARRLAALLLFGIERAAEPVR